MRMGPLQSQAGPCVVVRDLSRATVRRNAEYRLLSLCDAGLDQDPRFGGVLRDLRKDARTDKAVSPDVVRVLENAGSPCRVDALLPGEPNDERDHMIAALVLDAILEIDIAGCFTSGSAAYPGLIERDDWLVGTSTLAELSMTAIRHAERLELDEPDRLAARLYFWNRLPATHAWRSFWPDVEAVRQYLHVDRGGACRRGLEECFDVEAPPRSNFRWLSWRRANAQDRGRLFKLYVSPHPDEVDKAFAEVTTLLKYHRPYALKVGCDAFGLLRPDKLIVYFAHFEQLSAFAEALAVKLAGLNPHGVPFSCEVAGSGLLSWGVDPASTSKARWVAESSWRTWLCDQLATAMLAAGQGEHTVDRWRFALVRLALAGVDTRRWALQ